MSAYHKYRYRLVVNEDATHKICIPVLLQEKSIQLAHQGYQAFNS
jgi:hypothetical protein